MPRRLRYHLPEATYHVMLRGNDGQEIFFKDQDRCKMCLLIQEGIERFGHRVLAYCFMTNHVHLAIQVDQIPLSRIMQNLSFRYSQYINWRKQRIGHLFQGRFKSILVDSNHYLKELVRYIHLNPVRSGLVRQPERYQWSSHNAYLGTIELVWIEPDFLLRSFADTPAAAISHYKKFIHDEMNDVSTACDFKRGARGGIVGDDAFIKQVKEKIKIETESLLTIPDLIEAACELYEIDLETLRKPGKTEQAAHVRAILALLVRETPELTLEELARMLKRDASSLSKQAARLSAEYMG